MEKEYNIGIDIGSTSVGWAVVDSNTNEIVKKGKKALWGVRLFEEACTAADRRIARSNRRRFDRRRKRIKLLQAIFQEEIEKIDPHFFIKMKESFYNEKDTQNKTILLTPKEKQQIKQYNQKYPTIYHVRKELIELKEKKDIRLVYLAIHHIIKYRGNFLYAGETFNIHNLNIKEKWQEIFESLSNTCKELELETISLEPIHYEQLEKAILEPSNTDKKKKIEEILKPLNCKKEFIQELGKAITGNKFSIKKLLSLEIEEDIKTSFKGSSYEDSYDTIEKQLEEKIEPLEHLKELYNMLFLKTLFKENNTSLSTLMTNKYNQHKNSLVFLKQILTYNRKEYNKIFRSTTNYTCDYDKYIHNEIEYKELKEKIKKALENTLDKVTNQSLLDQYTTNYKETIESDEFLPRITEKDNGKFPYQIHLEELTKIIENQGKYYPFLLETGENNENKIKQLLKFRIPYYVGPLNTSTNTKVTSNPNAWFIRKTNQIITPYNFENVVDLEASAEKFITRMQSHCTYLLDEPVIPNNSILYSEYKVRNELKQIKVNNDKLPIDIQEKIYQNIFLKTDKCPTNEMLEKYLSTLAEYKQFTQLSIKGYSALNKFSSSMKSYVDFFGENGIFKNTNYTIEDADNIIYWITLFEDKKILEKKVKKQYPNLSSTTIQKILQKNYKGWSNLSEKLLTTKYYEEKETNNKQSILDLLRTKNQNFQQIINDKTYKFQKMINDFNNVKQPEKLTYQVVENLTTSPKNKRGIYQSLLVIEEIVKYMKKEPKRIIIEMAREEGKKQRTDSKKEYLKKLYEKSKQKIHNYTQLHTQLEQIEEEDLINQKLFLYFIQEGKSLYSRTPLNIEDLNSYEIDHIIPRTLIKDDSIDNKALVLKEENQRKAANVVLPNEYRNKTQITWWEHLANVNLISNKKLNNLKRSTYHDEDIEGFINRQLVETRQIIKHVANIIQNYHNKTDIVYLKANISHMYREKFELYKFRDLNDYHHAQDAYLAAVLGEYKQTYLKEINFDTLREKTEESIKKNLYRNLSSGYVINSMEHEFMRKKGKQFDFESWKQTIENTIYRNDILISKKNEIKTGEFYNQTKNKKGMTGVNLKDHLPSKWYGSYTSLKPSYITVIRFKEKNKEEQRMIGIPILIEEKMKINPNIKYEYIKSLLKKEQLDSLEILIEKIPFHTLLNWNNQICRLSGANDKVEVYNAKQFHIDKNHMKKWKYTLNKVLNKKGNVEIALYNTQLDEIITYIIQEIETNYKLYSNLIEELHKTFSKENIAKLSIEEKEKTIQELLKLIKCNSTCANLSFLTKDAKSLSKSFGRKKQQKIEHAKVYYQSITGIKEYFYEF